MNLASVIDKKLANSLFLIHVKEDGSSDKHTYRSLDEKSSWFARALVARGIKQEESIAVLANNSFEYVVAYYGALKAGIVAVLVNNKMTAEEINYVLFDSETKLLFSDDSRSFNIDTINMDDMESFYDIGEFETVSVEENHKAVFLYTSGSTGTPKGVVYTHGKHYWVIDNHSKEDSPAERFKKVKTLIITPLYHLNGLAGIEIQVKKGNIIVMLSKFKPSTAIKAIEEHKVTVIATITTTMALIANCPSIVNADLHTVKSIRIGSSITTESTINKIKKYFPQANILITYGTTETGPGMFSQHPEKKRPPATSVGYPIKGIEYRIVDGILQVKTPSIMEEYKNKKDLFDTRFTDDGFYITGDLFEVDENGFYYCLGRADEMFKSGGNIVYPSEIENLLESHPSISMSAVIAVEDDVKQFLPVAFVVATGISEEEIKEYILTKTAAYKHPRKVIFLDSIPTIGSGKVDKVKLKQYYKDNHVV
jgi:long-chain acyl-CoA synthetase